MLQFIHEYFMIFLYIIGILRESFLNLEGQTLENQQYIKQESQIHNHLPYFI